MQVFLKLSYIFGNPMSLTLFFSFLLCNDLMI